MDEITNNYTTWNTTSTSDNMIYQFDTSDGWFPYYQESTWLPYKDVKYIPRWHITQGYRNQIKTMWD